MGLKCSKCGNTEEFYAKERYKGTCNHYFRTDKECVENSDMYTYAEHSYFSKFIFCAECNAKVGTIDILNDFCNS